MNTLLKYSLMILLMMVGSCAQQPGQPRFQQRLQSIVRSEGPPSTKNYQLELSIQRGQKTARYKLALNSGGVTTELIDRLVEKQYGMAPLTISLSATFSPFDEGGGEVQVNLNRSIMFKTKVAVQEHRQERRKGASRSWASH
jgi:hypothetical protein